MATSKFYFYGPEADRNDVFVIATITGASYDGGLQFQRDSDKTTFTLEPGELESLRNRNLVMSEAEVGAAPDSLIKGIEDFAKGVEGLELSNDANAHLNESKKEMFRAAAKSA